MSESKSVLQNLGDYMTDILDKDRDGIVSVKEIFTVFPNAAVAIAVIFVDVLVALAEYRVWDFGVHVTGDPWKALGFVAISSIPFYLGQIFWLYPLGNIFQKLIALLFIGASLYTSWVFGTADLTLSYDIKEIARYLQDLTVGYIVFTLFYIVIDPTIKAARMKTQAQKKAQWQGDLNKIAQSVLQSLRGALEEQRNIEAEFGADEVGKMMDALRGKKVQANEAARPIMASDTKAIPELDPTTRRNGK